MGKSPAGTGKGLNKANGRRHTAQKTKLSRVIRRRSLGFPGDRGPIRARRKSPSVWGVLVRRGTGESVLCPSP